eukprot:8602774-Karenia_brevis.AAC.1
MISCNVAIAHAILWQCGLLGVRVGEAAHPGPTNETVLDDSSDSEVPVSPFKVHRMEICEGVAARMRLSQPAQIAPAGTLEALEFACDPESDLAGFIEPTSPAQEYEDP